MELAKITVIVPTYRRVQDLCRCLQALKQQHRQANEVLAVVRDTDQETREFIRSFDLERLPLRIVNVTRPGQVAALNAGLEAATGEIIAITDDDAAPQADWLHRIEAHFAADAHVGGVGGRDWQPIERGSRQVVGKLQWFGRVIGNHHLGVGPSREVDILKGVNMSYRRQAVAEIRFDERLLGAGSQIHNDMAFSLALKQAGWKLIYDPNVAVDHYPAQRLDEDKRGQFIATAHQNIVTNETLILLNFLPLIRRLAFLGWAFLSGSRGAPGLLQIPRLIVQQEPDILARVRATYAGRLAGLAASLHSVKVVRRDKE